jgi:hypothetical protein
VKKIEAPNSIGLSPQSVIRIAILGHRAVPDNIAALTLDGAGQFAVFPVQTGNSSICPIQPAFGREKNKPNHTLVGQFP